MQEFPRKKSPRAPSMPLPEALEKALRIYDREGRQPLHADVIAQSLGYKSANNGAALAAIAALRSFRLLEKVAAGKLAVAKEVETYKFAPSGDIKSELENKWLKSPPVFASLLDKYGSGLASDATIRSILVASGFNPATAESVITAFKASVEFTKIFEKAPTSASSAKTDAEHAEEETRRAPMPSRPEAAPDRIPVRLSGGRRAWLEIPSPFYSADKNRLKAQIDLLLADDEEENPGE